MSLPMFLMQQSKIFSSKLKLMGEDADGSKKFKSSTLTSRLLNW